MVGAGRCCSAITLAWVSLARNHAASPCRPGRQADDKPHVIETTATLSFAPLRRQRAVFGCRLSGRNHPISALSTHTRTACIYAVSQHGELAGRMTFAAHRIVTR